MQFTEGNRVQTARATNLNNVSLCTSHKMKVQWEIVSVHTFNFTTSKRISIKFAFKFYCRINVLLVRINSVRNTHLRGTQIQLYKCCITNALNILTNNVNVTSFHFKHFSM